MASHLFGLLRIKARQPRLLTGFFWTAVFFTACSDGEPLNEQADAGPGGDAGSSTGPAAGSSADSGTQAGVGAKPPRPFRDPAEGPLPRTPVAGNAPPPVIAGDPTGTGGAASTPPASGIAVACEGDGCEDGLYCHDNLDTYIGHGQCTDSCTDSDYCEQTHGDGHFCIGANICVKACAVDADCPEKSVCNDSHWCQRTGPGSGVPYCTGSIIPCALRVTDAECISSLGCQTSGDCGGSATACSLIFSSFDCTSQDGCTWDYDSDSCGGVAKSCFQNVFDFECDRQAGCSWNFSCTGNTIYDCAETNVSLCGETPGCVVSQ